jgi:hypothetical protein
MRISRHNALSYFTFMDQAKLALQHMGEDGKDYAERLAVIRGTFNPDDIQDSFFDSIDALVTNVATLTERDMKPVEKCKKIEPAPKRLRPEADRAIRHLTDARNWLRDHQE